MSTPLPTSVRRPSTQAAPRPTRRGWRMHQKASTSATKSGTSSTFFQGRKLASSASASEMRIVLARTGKRMREAVASLSCIAVLSPRLARLAGLFLARGRGFLGRLRGQLVVLQHEHVAAALHAGCRLADDARERVGGVALDARDGGDRKAGRIDAVDS